jgi:hypothetical protein
MSVLITDIAHTTPLGRGRLLVCVNASHGMCGIAQEVRGRGAMAGGLDGARNAGPTATCSLSPLPSPSSTHGAFPTEPVDDLRCMLAGAQTIGCWDAVWRRTA